MFDIGFTEILLIAVVAIMVVGPKEFPALVRTIGTLFGRARSFAGEVKSEFHREIARTEELARRIERETEIAELHKLVDETKATVPIGAPGTGAKSQGKETAGGIAAADAPPRIETKADGEPR